MKNQPSVLLLDDGELGNVHRMLLELGTDVVRLQGAEIGRTVEAPRHLLITAGRRTLRDMPELVTAPDDASTPIWVCIHNQDYLPLRERLCEMGVNYLLLNALDEQSRRSFLTQLLRLGTEHRRSHRLHLGGDIRYRTKAAAQPGKLIDLSMEGCQVVTTELLASGMAFVTMLPPALGGGEELELAGTVLRSSEYEVRGVRKGYATVARFDEFDDSRREQLSSIIEGKRIGTKITPLASLPDDWSNHDDASGADANRRSTARQPYERGVHVIGMEASSEGPVLGCDLSLTGVRLTGCAGLEVDAHVTVALFGSSREEPTVVQGTVVRKNDDGEAALFFDELSATNKRALQKLLSSQVILDALNQPNSEMGRTVMADVRSGDTAARTTR